MTETGLAKICILIVHGVTVGASPDLVGGVVETEGKVMILVDVPVQTAQELEVVFVLGVVGVTAGVVTVGVHQVFGNAVQICRSCTGDVVLLIHIAVLGSTPGADFTRVSRVLEAAEEEEFVLDDGAADSCAVNGAVVGSAGNILTAVNVLATELYVLVVHIAGALEGVGTGLGDGVDAAADEVGLTDIIGRNHNLNFLDGVHGDRHTAAGKGIAKAEVVVEVSTVNSEVGATAVAAAEAHAAATVR